MVWSHRSIVLALVLLLGLFGCARAPEPVVVVASPTPAPAEPEGSVCTPGAVVATTAMVETRAAHTATLLQDGTVLLAGGFAGGEQATDSAEIFDPVRRTFSPVGPMTAGRHSHAATLLASGQVLLTGGYNGDYLASAEVFDPESGTFTAVESMTMGRSGHRATLLPDGRVLLSGGVGVGWTFLASAELYDPARGTFEATGGMTHARESHTATLLANGQVLVTGGHEGRRAAITIYDSAELYDPARGTFVAAAAMTVRRHKHDATLLEDGRVLISGGADERDAQGVYQSAELYDPGADAFVPAGQMKGARYKHTGTSLRLSDGRVLLVGGSRTTELYDPRRGVFEQVTPGVGEARLFATTTLLPTGEILFAGGYGSEIAAGRQAWLLSTCAPTTQTTAGRPPA